MSTGIEVLTRLLVEVTESLTRGTGRGRWRWTHAHIGKGGLVATVRSRVRLSGYWHAELGGLQLLRELEGGLLWSNGAHLTLHRRV